jgi:aminoglycoside phosphotransferase (APT) family kinase protein
MSNAQYLWAVARGLQSQVHPATPPGAGRDALENSIHILTVIANALEPTAPSGITRPAAAAISDKRADTDRLRGPAENSAAYGDTAEALAAVARALDASTGSDPAKDPNTRAFAAWEKALLDAAIKTMDEAEAARSAAQHDPRMQIDSAALQSYMRTRFDSPKLAVSEFRQILGGRSRQTAVFRIAQAPGLAETLVVQRQLPGLIPAPSFATVAAQYEVLKRVHAAGLKAPKPLCFETDETPLGSAFLIVEKCRGSTVEPNYWLPPKSAAIVMQLAEQLALLHQQPIGELGAILPRSRERGDRQGWSQELDGFAKEWQRMAHWPSVSASAALAWLRANIDCVEDRQSLVHNDTMFHNILADGDELTALLDWEQASVGHPAEDLGYCYPIVSAVVDWDSFLQAYYAAGGPKISARQVDFFALRGIIRLMGLVLKGGRDSFESGLANDVLVASAGAFFSQRLLHRLAQVLDAVLKRH